MSGTLITNVVTGSSALTINARHTSVGQPGPYSLVSSTLVAGTLRRSTLEFPQQFPNISLQQAAGEQESEARHDDHQVWT